MIQDAWLLVKKNVVGVNLLSIIYTAGAQVQDLSNVHVFSNVFLDIYNEVIKLYYHCCAQKNV